ncbi:hypothetical protein JHK82_023923 [Glycine max]|uniref:Uncharacterized protein n=1 Tax=Glycine soja TaxID=3848 RepID=A0A0B2PU79_GLYSO|nr:hypothetical protein JHK82_023923 [Glycine max]KHN12881.1 hypothetical protein glysoja_029415 [Glycine soja]
MADLMKRILLMEAEQASKWSKHGTSNSHNTYGSGSQNGSTINSGNHHNNGNRYDHSYHYDERPIYNRGTFNGDGNGSHIQGDFDSSERNYYGRRYGY